MDGGCGAIGRGAVRGMIFAASDLHGFPLVRFMNGLKAIGFGENDFLYILGDVVDRHGDGGAAMLRWMSLQRNMQLLMGNHEYMMLSCAEMLYDASPERVKRMSREDLRKFLHWSDNGGTATLNGFAALRKTDPESIPRILAYVSRAPYFAVTRVCGRDFLLTHAGLGNFSEDKPIQEYTAEELLWNRPSLEDAYFDSAMTVFGHTPTIMYGQEYAGKIIRTRTWCNIDVNTAAHDHIAVLRLDDMREFYI